MLICNSSALSASLSNINFLLITTYYRWYRGHAVAQLVEALRFKSEGHGFDSQWFHWNFSLTQSFRPHYGPEVDSASNRNEYQEYFLGIKAAGAQAWQPYHLHVPIVLKSGSLNLLETSKSVQACNGIALPLLVVYWNSEISLIGIPAKLAEVTNMFRIN